jgi:hypothetical protein
MRAIGLNRLLGAWETLALIKYIHHPCSSYPESLLRSLLIDVVAGMQPPSKPSVHFEDGIEEDVNTPPTRPRSQRVRMIVPEPSLLSSSPLPSEPPSEPHTQDAQDDESEDSLPLRKRHRRDMSEEALDRVFNGLNDILQRNERLKTQAKKKT